MVWRLEHRALATFRVALLSDGFAVIARGVSAGGEYRLTDG